MSMEGQLPPGERSVLTLHPHWKILLRPPSAPRRGDCRRRRAADRDPAGPGSRPGKDRGGGGRHHPGRGGSSAVPFLRWKTTTYQLTTRRIQLRNGILTRSGRDFPLIRISDVSFSQGPVDRLLGTGRLVVESAGEHGQLILNDIPDVQEVQSTLFQLVEDEQRRLAREDR